MTCIREFQYPFSYKVYVLGRERRGRKDWKLLNEVEAQISPTDFLPCGEVRC